MPAATVGYAGSDCGLCRQRLWVMPAATVGYAGSDYGLPLLFLTAFTFPSSTESWVPILRLGELTDLFV